MSNDYQKLRKIIFVFLIIFILVIFIGCTQKQNDSNDDQDNEVNIERFYGHWQGMELKNEISLNITFKPDNIGKFQDTNITWKINDSTLELGMFEGLSPSYYEFSFSNNYSNLTLNNIYSDETFKLRKT